ncbi:MAG: hypothetical protein PHR15_06735 [Atopobiaceae bacterium]|nr:hypothetical protein [Atopobiaceae bacterium]MCH4181206.1 hypothetical protein [Atopobiaceae bacterium]MCH4214971.1 hypothetical protein [Atopobiaceae bacterium]MCH4230660.1 hypothetical protein [Atopobiaceae bacterium]MCH4277123.1 hypothetical protein [Atopobiaceae bacterium]
MLYLGNFSYNDDKDDAENYCLMPAVVEAPSPEDAMDAFARMMRELRANSDLLDGAGEVYLDSLVELEAAPTKALLVQWQKIVPSEDGLCSILSALPTAPGRDVAEAFGVYGDDDDDSEDVEADTDEDLDGDACGDEPIEAEEVPFLSFDEE